MKMKSTIVLVDDEHNILTSLGMALEIGIVISFAGVLMASLAGETAALRMHAAELLMMLGTGIVMLVEGPVLQADRSMASGELSLQQT